MRKYLFLALGAVAGGLVGTTIALLFAPSSGVNLRGQISDYTQSVSEDVRKAAREKREELEIQLAKLREPL